jgi:hypothetical protein
VVSSVGYVPLTKRLVVALNGARHLRGPRVLCGSEGKPLTQKMIQVMMRRVANRANVKAGVHILRHTFCSHLAMKGAPARAIQELAGHQDVGTTQRYMHLSPTGLGAAIRLLDAPAENRGGIEEPTGARVRTPRSCRRKWWRRGDFCTRASGACGRKRGPEGSRRRRPRARSEVGNVKGAPPSEVNKWRRRDLHPGPKIHPRRTLRCVSVSMVSRLT